MIIIPCVFAGWSLRLAFDSGNALAGVFGVAMLLIGGWIEAALWDENDWLNHRLIVLEKRETSESLD